MTSQFKAADTMDRGPSWRALIAALFTVLSVVGAACTTSPGTGQVDDPGPAPSSLPAPVSTHGDGKVSLEWTVEGAPPGATYEWEWRKYGTQVWSSQPTSEPQVELSTVLDARTTYWARVRWVDGETLGEWSSGAKFFYADLTLPVLRIDTDGGAPIIDKENYLGATISIDPNGSGDTAYSPARTEIKGRGNSTWGAPKKPYKLKLSSKASLLGMPASKHWVLLANFFDPSHLRNEIAFQLSKQTSLAWTPRFRFVEVILNGSYDGLYMLGEHIRVEPTRVNIDEMDENDLEGEALTGGYLMEFDFRFNPSIDPGFVSSTGLKVEVKDPEPVEPQQLSYINSYFNSFEAATLGSSFKDPSLGYAAYLDVDKFIDWYLIAELARQQDGMMSSTYVSKPRNGKLTFGPVWDFDLSMGALNSLTPGWPSEGWHINNPALWTFSDVGKWLPRLFQDPALKAQVKARWQALAPALLNVVDSIPTTGAAIDPARDTDAARWRNYPHDPDLDPTLQSWLRRRINWMGANL